MQDRSITVAVLDFGSNTIKLALAEKNIRGEGENATTVDDFIKVVHFGQVRSEGAIVRGIIRNLTDTAGKVNGLIKEAEEKTGVKINSLYVLVDSQGLQSKLYSANLEFSQPQEIKNNDLKELLKLVKPEANKFSFDNPYARFYVGGTYAERPVGVKGLNLKGEFQFFQADQYVIENIEDVLENKLGLEVHSYWVAPALLGERFLTDEQMRIGSAVIDFGAETTSIAIYKNGFLEGLRVLPIGSQQITNDLMHLEISLKEAERLKVNEGTVLLDLKDNEPLKVVSADNVSKKEVTRYRVNQYIEARMREIVDNIKQIIRQFVGNEKLSGGIIVTGGGSKIGGLQTYLIEMLETAVEQISFLTGSDSINTNFLEYPGTHAMYSLLHRATVCCTDISESQEDVHEVEERPEEVKSTAMQEDVKKEEVLTHRQPASLFDEDLPHSSLDPAPAPETYENDRGGVNGYQTDNKQAIPPREEEQPNNKEVKRDKPKKKSRGLDIIKSIRNLLPFDWEDMESDDETV